MAVRNRDIVFTLKMQNQANAAIRQLAQQFGTLGTNATKAGQNVNQITLAMTKMGQAANTNVKGTISQLQALASQAARTAAAVAGAGRRVPGGGSGGGANTGLVGGRTAGALAGGIGAAASQAAALGSAIAGIKGFETFAKFDQELHNFQAVTQASTADVQRLKDGILQMSQGAIFGPNEIAKGMSELGRAGKTADESIKEMPAAINLATAAGTDLNTGLDILMKTMSAYGIESERAGAVADVMAKAANQSQISLQELSGSMKYAAPVAAELGVSFNDTAAAIGVLGDAGRRGFKGGTDVRNYLTDLIVPTKKTQETLKQLGLTFEQVDPRKVGLIGSLEAFASKNLDAASATRIFNKEGAAGALIMVNNVEKLKQYSDGTKAAAGSALQAAETQMQGIGNQITKMQAAAERAAIQLFGAFGPAIGKIVGAVTTGLNSLGSLFAQLQGFGGEISQMLDSTQNKFIVFGAAIGALALVNPFLAAIAGAAALAGWLYSIRDTYIQVGDQTVTVGATIQAAWDDANKALEAANNAVNNAGQATHEWLVGLVASMSEVWTQISDGAALGIASIQDALAGLPAAFASAAQDAGNALIDGIAKGVNAAIGLINSLIGAINSALAGINKLSNAAGGGDLVGAIGAIGNVTLPHIGLSESTMDALGGNRNPNAAVNDAKLAITLREAVKGGFDDARDAAGRRSGIGADPASPAISEITKAGQSVANALGAQAATIDAQRRGHGPTGEQRHGNPAALNTDFTGQNPVNFGPAGAGGGGGGGGRKGGGGGGRSQRAEDSATADIDKRILKLQEESKLMGLVGNERERMKNILDEQAKLQGNANLTDEQRNKLLADYTAKLDQLYAQLGKVQTGMNGFREGLAQYATEAGNVFDNAKKFGTDTMNTLEDALVEFATTGKLDVKKLINSILSDFLRLLVIKPLLAQLSQGIASLGSGLGGLFGGGGGGGGFVGGLLSIGGGLYHSGGIVGHGMEGMTGSRTVSAATWANAPRFHTGGIVGHGEVPIIAKQGEAVLPTVRLPNGQFGVRMANDNGKGSNGLTMGDININVTSQSTGDKQRDDAAAKEMGKQISAAVDQQITAWVTNQMRPGGILRNR